MIKAETLVSICLHELRTGYGVVPPLGSRHTETINASADTLTGIGTVKPDPVASPHGGDLLMTVRILSKS
jgi:hypothetical protein